MATPDTSPLLNVLTRFSGSKWVQDSGLGEIAQRVLYRATRETVRVGRQAQRQFAPLVELRERVRKSPRKSSEAALFDLTPSDEQEMTREVLRRFAAEHIVPIAALADEDPERALAAVEAAQELALPVEVVPEAVGGIASEREVISGVLVAQTLAEADAAVGLAILASRSVAAVLADYGTADQQSRYLAALVAEPDQLPQSTPFGGAALALLEPEAQADPMVPRTRALPRGSTLRLRGTKAMVPMVDRASLFIVTAQAEDGPAAFVVPADAPGLTLERTPTMGFAASRLGRLRLDDVIVSPADRLAADYDHGRLVDLARIGSAALTVGICRAVVDYVITYANDREAFGEPISHRQAVAFSIADMATELEGMELATWQAAAQAERGRDCARAAKIAELLAAEHGMRIGSLGVQLLGGHGYIREHPVERWYRQLRGVNMLAGVVP